MKQKKQYSGFLGALSAPLVASFMEQVIFSVVKGIGGGGVGKPGRGYMNEFF